MIRSNVYIDTPTFTLLLHITLYQVQKYNYLDIKFNNRNQVDDKSAWELDGGFLSFLSSFVR